MTKVILKNPPTRFDHKKTDVAIHVLHLDDELGILTTAKQILEIEDQFKVESVKSVDEALEKIEEQMFDVVLSDYEMPEKNGLDFLQILRENGNHIPFILFTGKGREEVAIKALNLGADYYLNKMGKPETTFGELSHILKKVVKQSRTEIKLDLERKRLQTVTKNMRAGLAVISRDYRLLWVNDVLKQALGDDYKRKVCYDLINGLEEPCFGCGINEVFESNKDVVVHEQVVKGPEGRDIWLEITVTPIKDPNGRIVAALELVNNITDRKNYEKKLEQTEKSYRNALDNLLEGYQILGFDWKYLYINDVAASHGRRTKEELLGKSILKMYPGIENTAIFSNLRKCMTDRVPIKMENEFFFPSGKKGWFKLNILPVPQGIAVVSQELTEHRNALKEAKDTSARLQFLLDTSKIGIGHYDLDGNILLLNPQACTYMGAKSEEDFVGKNVTEVFGNDMGNLIMERIKGEVKESKNRIYEDNVNLPSGMKWFLSSYNKIVDSEGKITGVQVISNDITERKNAEIKNERLKEEFESYVNLARVMLVALDSKGRIDFVNKKGYEVLETTKQETIGKEWFSNFLPKQVRKQTEEYFKKLMSGKINEIEYHENSIVTRSGSERMIRWRNTLLKDDAGKICGILSSGEDITERKKAKEKLIKSEEKYRNIVELSPNGILIANMHGIITDVNNSILKMTGFSKSDFVGKHFTELSAIDAKDIPKYARMPTSFMGGKTPKKFVTPYITKTGARKTAEVYMNPMKEGKKRVGIQFLIIDITDRENKEKQISNLAKFPSQNPNPVLRVDKAGKILYANKAAENYGFILDKKGTRYITKELKETITNSFNSGSSDTVELEIGSKTFSFVVAPIPNEDYVNIYGHEITESKKYEVLLEKTMNDLIKINEKLNVVGKFTRHDTRNKLSVIANNIFLAKLQLAENHKAFEYLLNVESALDHIEKILSFTKTYEMLGVEKLSYQSVKKYIDAAANILDPNKVKIINTCEGLKVYADSLLRQMFYNLMDNSLKHGKTVTEIKISCEVFDESLKLIYEDNGIGIPENEKEKVFEKGYGKNTGLGLYIIEKICEAYDWTLKEEGIPGKGAQFTITIPKGKFKLKASESKTD